MKPNIFRSKAASLSNRKITAFLTIFSLLAGFLVLPRQFSPLLPTAEAASTTVVISEFRVRGPNGGNDEFIELYNLTNNAINIGGWKINGSNNAATAGTRLTITAGTMIPAHGHFLAVNSAASGYSGSIAGNQTYGTGVTDDGGIALLDGSNVVIDQVAMSTGSAYKEGTVLVSLGSSTASNLNRCYERKPGGASGSTQDTDVNSADFQLITPCDPQNLASPPTPSVTTTPTPTPSPTLTPTPSPTPANNPPTITAPTNPITTVVQDSAPFTVGLTGSDDNNVFNWSATAGTGVSTVTVTGGQGTGSVTYTVTLTPGFSGTANFTARLSDNANPQVSQLVNVGVTATPPPPLDHMVISQIYGGGGNGGATYQYDYVELFNAGTVSFDLGGWTIQYGSATGDTWQAQPLGGIVQPGEYYLVSLGAGNEVRPPLPVTPNVSGTINLSATNGKVALVSGGDPLDGCPVTGTEGVVDLVGFGTANCREGGTNAQAGNNTTAIYRKNGGFTDTNVNGSDFQTGAPNPRRTTPIQEIGPYVLNVDPRNNSTRAPRDLSVTVNFTESVDVSGAWYDINCASTGSHNDATVVGSGSFRLITPNVTFHPGEQCTATIFANAVSDTDSDDGPGDDNLKADFSWTFTIATGTAPPYPPSVHLTLGNPNGAVADVNQPNNYLMEKPEFSLSYNRDRGTPNWVSWHLTDEWIGSLERIDTFRPDPQVPADWYRVTQFDYANSGFDRGHMTPNADRDPETSIPINQATFLMSNMIPQAPNNNQGPWADMENDLRAIAGTTNELYIIAGGEGTGGTGDNGGVTTTIAGGKITIPEFTWKVALVLPKGEDDASRVNCSTRTIGVIMPNSNTFNGTTIRDDDWQDFIVSVDAVEALTGYDFYSNLPDPVERCVEAGTNGANPPLDTDEDTVPDSTDNCDFDANADQLDTDNDGQGDECDADDDNDGVADTQDAFPLDLTESIDTDGDGTGNNADGDDDNDGVSDTAEIAAGSDPLNAASTSEVCDGIDNDLNDGVDEGFTNTDSDVQADCVDADDDNDGGSDTAEAAAGSDPLDAASTPEICDGVDNDLNDGVDEGFTNTDGEGQADCVDTDDDNDGASDTAEATTGSDPLNAASTPEVCDGVDNDLNEGIDEGFTNTDGDGQADCVDSDDDNDGATDAAEIAAGSDPLSSASTPEVCDGLDNDLDDGVDESFANTDGDGQADCVDPDDDNDGVSDVDETTAGSDPLNANSRPEVCDGLDNDLNDGVDEGFTNTDGEGQADCVDPDDDNDGVSDVDETAAGSDPLNSNSTPEICDGLDNDLNEGVDESFINTDGDMQANCVDPDDDNDGVMDVAEISAGSDPLNPASTPEICDGLDNDLNDGVDEGFTNTDGDALADCVDPDDDNDGQTDVDEIACGSDPLNAESKSPDIDNDNIPDCVDPIRPPTTVDQCKDDGWRLRTRNDGSLFKSQGDCIQFVITGN